MEILMNWNELYSGKFFGGAALSWNEELAEYQHTKHRSTHSIIGVLETTDNNTLYSTIDKYKNIPTDSSLRPSMYRMMRYLSPDARQELHRMYTVALTEAKKYFTSWYASGLVIVPPDMKAPSHRHFSEDSKFTFTYVFSSGDTATSGNLVVEDNMFPLPRFDKEFFFCIDSTKMHSTTRSEDDKNCYLYFTFDDVDITNIPFNINQIYVKQEYSY